MLNVKRTLALSAISLASLVSIANADEAAVRKAFEAKLPGLTIESVSATPIKGMYEVIATGRKPLFFYTDESVSYIVQGNLLDLRSGQPRSITQESMNKRNTAALTKSTASAIKRVKGNGKRVIYTFEDPNCGYCKELQKQLAKLNDVTIYTFLWAILSQDSLDKSKAIWCAPDRAKAWDDYMVKGISPAGKRDCATPLELNSQTAQRLGLNGTPGVFLENGEQIGGFVKAEELEAALGAAR